MVAKIKTIITYLMLNLGVIKEKFHDYWSAKKFQEGNQMTFWKKLFIQIYLHSKWLKSTWHHN